MILDEIGWEICAGGQRYNKFKKLKKLIVHRGGVDLFLINVQWGGGDLLSIVQGINVQGGDPPPMCTRGR